MPSSTTPSGTPATAWLLIWLAASRDSNMNIERAESPLTVQYPATKPAARETRGTSCSWSAWPAASGSVMVRLTTTACMGILSGRSEMRWVRRTRARGSPIRLHHPKLRPPHADQRAVDEPRPSRQPLPVHEGAVGRSQVGDVRGAVPHPDDRVIAADLIVVEPDAGVEA